MKVKEQKEKLAATVTQRHNDIRAVMRTPEGRRFFWRLLDEANLFRSCFTGNSQTFYLEGRREFMLPFYSDLMAACPEMFFQAQRENFKAEVESGKPQQTGTRGAE